LATAAFRFPTVTAGKLRSILDRFGVAIATVLLLILLAWLLTQWAWLFLQPRNIAAPPPVTKIDINAAAGRVVGANLFGVAGESDASADAQMSTLNLRLTGVFAFDQESPSFAIVNTGSKTDEAFKVGDQITPGVVLGEVHPTHILIRRGGALERVNLEERPEGAGARPQPQPRPSTAPPQQFRPRGPTSAPASVSRGDVAASLKDPKQIANMGRVNVNPSGGIVVEDVPPGSLAERLGLQVGDIIRHINGKPVNSPTDLGRLYMQLGMTPQIHVDGVRGDRPLNLTYNVQQ
jgi:general secretion pathway protein C